MSEARVIEGLDTESTSRSPEKSSQTTAPIQVKHTRFRVAPGAGGARPVDSRRRGSDPLRPAPDRGPGAGRLRQLAGGYGGRAAWFATMPGSSSSIPHPCWRSLNRPCRLPRRMCVRPTTWAKPGRLRSSSSGSLPTMIAVGVLVFLLVLAGYWYSGLRDGKAPDVASGRR